VVWKRKGERAGKGGGGQTSQEAYLKMPVKEGTKREGAISSEKKIFLDGGEMGRMKEKWRDKQE